MLDHTDGISVPDASAAAGGKILYLGNKAITGGCIDSRKTQAGDLFVAVRGENTDGHKFIDSAAKSGAAAVLISDPDVDFSCATSLGCSVILVDDTVRAFGRIAKEHKSRCKPFTAAVTGSVGKTTTRQFVRAMLAQKYNTHSTDGNFNNELGLPLTLMKLNSSHGAVALELGMSQKGEISYLTDIVRPDIAMITNIGTSHIEFFGSREGIRDAKMEIAEGLVPGGKLLLNGDEPLLRGIKDAEYVALDNKNADFRAENIRFSPDGMTFDAVIPDRTVRDCHITTLGEHTVLDAMFAVACGYFIGLGDEEIRKGLLDFEQVGMRQHIVDSDGVTYVLDYYNASPESVKASLGITSELAKRTGGRTVACLGNMLELGDSSAALHRSIGEFAAALPCDILIAFGSDARLIADEAVKRGMNPDGVFAFPDISDPRPAADTLKRVLRQGDCVLFKASNSVKLGRVAELVVKED